MYTTVGTFIIAYCFTNTFLKLLNLAIGELLQANRKLKSTKENTFKKI